MDRSTKKNVDAAAAPSPRVHLKRKASAFRILSALPFGGHLHYWLQRHITRTLPQSPAQLDDHVIAARRKLDALRVYAHTEPSRSVVLEFGSGHDLAGPLALTYAGVAAVLALDIRPLAKLDLVRDAARHIAVAHGQPAPHIASWRDLRTACRVYYRAPADARATALPAHSIDCVTSWSTLQHIPVADIVAILRESRRILKPGGVAIMKIHYEDMYARDDALLSPFQFLCYSDEEWASFNSALHYQNRMRHSQCVALFEEAGFEIVYEETKREQIDDGVLARLASPFRSLDPDDVFTSKGLIVARSK
jgi:SAM-dependent methyltransferase